MVRWLNGTMASIDAADEDTPVRLAELIQALHGVDATGFEWTTYRGRLDPSDKDDRVRGQIAVLGGDRDWSRCGRSRSPRRAGTGQAEWLHADLHEGNLLFTGGAVTGVIDGSRGRRRPGGGPHGRWLSWTSAAGGRSSVT